MKTRRTSIIVSTVLATALALSACGSAEEAITERVLEEAGGEGVDVEIGDDGEITSIETDEGSIEVGSGGELPEEWPADVPTFDDGTITGSQVLDSNGETYVSVSYASQADPAAAVDAMKASLEEAGFSIISNSDMTDGAGAGLSSIVAERENVSVTFSASGAPGEDTVLQASVIIKPA